MKQALIVFLFIMMSGLGGGAGGGGLRSDGGSIRYVALGASDAVGVGAVPITDGYVYRIRRALNACGVRTDLDNIGIPGIEITQVEDIQTPAAILLKPDLVTLWPGPNDLVRGRSPADFESHLQTVLSRLRSGTDAFIVIANLPDMTRLPTFRSNPDRDVTRARIAAFNAAIRRQARAHGAALVNLSRQPVTSNLVSDVDGFHPNDAGYRKIADAFLKVIRRHYCS